MFTGIIEAVAEVQSITNGRLVLARPATFNDIKLGSSICVSGVCLSVIAFDEKTMTFDVVPTTFQKSTLGSLTSKAKVNLERAMSANGRFEGHIVQGHCEGVGVVTSFEDGILSIQIPPALTNLVVTHGSITIDGVSLTVASIKDQLMTVALIPLTMKDTTLGSLKKNDHVNLESDILGRYVLHSHVAR
jgi:riboflavin synthase